MRSVVLTIVLAVLLAVRGDIAFGDVDIEDLVEIEPIKTEEERQAARARIQQQIREAEARAAEAAEEAERRRKAALEAWNARPLGERRMIERCTKCHELPVVTNARHTKLGWHLVTLRMRWLNDAQIDEETRSVIVEHLASRQPLRGVEVLLEYIQMLLFVLIPTALFWGYRALSRKAVSADRRIPE